MEKIAVTFGDGSIVKMHQGNIVEVSRGKESVDFPHVNSERRLPEFKADVDNLKSGKSGMESHLPEDKGILFDVLSIYKKHETPSPESPVPNPVARSIPNPPVPGGRDTLPVKSSGLGLNGQSVFRPAPGPVYENSEDALKRRVSKD